MVRTLAVLSALVLALPAPAQGVLAEARQAADGKPSSSSGKSSKSDDDDSILGAILGGILEGLFAPSCDHGEDGVGSMIGLGLVTAVGFPFWLPPKLLERHLQPIASFPGAPYSSEGTNYLLFSAQEPAKPWAVRFAVEEGNDFQGLNRVGGRLLLDSSTRFGVAANLDHYLERCGCGRSDQLMFGDVALTYRFAECEWMQMHAGLGGRLMFGDGRTRGGFNFLYSADVFPVRPLVVSASMELGTMKEAFAMRLRASAGVQIRAVEAFVGWDWLRIGSADLWGPMAGLRLWF